MAVVFLYPIWILVFQREKINGGLFGQLVLGFASLVILPFLFKFSKRWLGKRRIEIRVKEDHLAFMQTGSKENRRISFHEVKTFKIERHKYLAMTVHYKNYSIILETNTGEDVHLCTSDNLKNIEAIYDLITDYLPRFFQPN